MATPQDYLNLMTALRLMPSPALTLQLQKMLEAQPELAETVASTPANPNAVNEYHRHNTTMPQWPAHFLRPRSEDELVNMLEAKKNSATSFRAMAEGFGFANAAWTKDCLVQCFQMNDLLDLEADTFHEEKEQELADDLVRVESGITFGKLNDALAQIGKTVCQQPGYRDLTVVGCASAGGHGSGLGLYGIAGWIEAVELVNFDAQKNVRVMRIERTDGLTDPAKYKNKHPEAKYVLRQDDALFHAARCGQGHLGIISAVTLRTRPRFFLKEDRFISTWDEALPQINQLLVHPAVHGIHVWINPYVSTGKTSPTVLITKLTKATQQPWPWGVRGPGILFGGRQIITDFIGYQAATDPKGVAAKLDFALDACRSTNVLMPSTQALDFGPPNDLAVNAASVGFDASRADEVLKALITQFDSWRQTNNWVTSPIGMRWVKASEDCLSPQYQRDTIMLEVPILKGTPNAAETLDKYTNYMMDTFDGRPHWGQQNPMTRAQFERNYAAGLPAFLAAFRELNPLESFDGPLTAQLGLRELSQMS